MSTLRDFIGAFLLGIVWAGLLVWALLEGIARVR